MENEGKIVEIQIRLVRQLSEAAQKEVEQKLATKPETFNFKGYAQVLYAEASPLRVDRVDPIEGTALDFFKGIAASIQPK